MNVYFQQNIVVYLATMCEVTGKFINFLAVHAKKWGAQPSQSPVSQILGGPEPKWPLEVYAYDGPSSAMQVIYK